jgi:hypothetical protein
MSTFDWIDWGKTLKVLPSRLTGRFYTIERHTMSAAITSGTYREAAVSGALRQMMSSLFGRPAARLSQRAALVRRRAQEANEVRALARSVELDSPGFASDLYAAAARHEGLDD